MDAKTRSLALLAGLSLFCAGVAWISDYSVLGSVFFAFGGVATIEIAWDHWHCMDKDYLALKRASASRPSGEWRYDDYDVIADGVVVGRIMKAAAAPVGQPWMWTLVLYHEGRTPTHGYEPTREAAMAAFAKSWRRQ